MTLIIEAFCVIFFLKKEMPFTTEAQKKGNKMFELCCEIC